MEQIMYIGPTIPGVVERNRIFRGKLPDEVEKRAKEDRYFKNLLIPVDKLITARQELSKKGSVMAVSFLKISNSLKG